MRGPYVALEPRRVVLDARVTHREKGQPLRTGRVIRG